MHILNSSDMSKLDAKNAQMKRINPRVRALLSPGTSNAFSDHPGFWRANDSQPFTAIWGCKAIVPAEAIRTRYF
jgi:hypothetical protein